MDATINRLNLLFKKDSTVTKYQGFESNAFKRPSAMSFQAFLNEFDKRLFKTKTYDTTMSDNILAYQLLSQQICQHITKNQLKLQFQTFSITS